jgi:hypothetical protein
MDAHSQIVEIAHQIWEQKGRPNGEQHYHCPCCHIFFKLKEIHWQEAQLIYMFHYLQDDWEVINPRPKTVCKYFH